MNSLRAALVSATNHDFSFVTGKPIIIPDASEYVSLEKSELKTEGMFRFIRNAFAHGEFEIHNGVYYLENHTGGRLVGKALLKETTLLKWINIVETLSLQNVGGY